MLAQPGLRRAHLLLDWLQAQQLFNLDILAPQLDAGTLYSPEVYETLLVVGGPDAIAIGIYLESVEDSDDEENDEGESSSSEEEPEDDEDEPASP